MAIFNVGSGMGPRMNAMVDRFDALYRAQPGCRSVVLFGDESTGEYGSFSVWETQADAEAASEVVATQLQDELAGLIPAGPARRFFKVLEPMAAVVARAPDAPSP